MMHKCSLHGAANEILRMGVGWAWGGWVVAAAHLIVINSSKYDSCYPQFETLLSNWLNAGTTINEKCMSTNATLGNTVRLNRDPFVKLFHLSPLVNVSGFQSAWIAQMSSSTTAECGRFYFREHCQDFPQTSLTFHALQLLGGGLVHRLSGNVGSVLENPKIERWQSRRQFDIASHFRWCVVTLLKFLLKQERWLTTEFKYRVFSFHWFPPKKLKYVKPRLGESTLT